MLDPIFNCGFECGVFSSSIHIHETTNASFSTTTVRTGSRSLRLNPSSAIGRARFDVVGRTVIVWRFYLRFASLPASDTMLAYCFGSTTKAGLGFKQSDSSLYPARDFTTPAFGSSGIAVTTGVWYRIDLKVNASANPWLVDLIVDGAATNQFSIATATESLVTMKLGSDGTETFDLYIDDLVMSGDAGDYPIGAGFVSHFVPTADGTHNVAGTNDFERTLTGTDIDNTTTDSYLLVDDVPFETGASVDWINLINPPNATDYVENIFGPAPGVPTPSTAPRAVSFTVAYHAAAVQANNLRIAFRDHNGGTQDDVRNATVAADSVVYAHKEYPNIPGGGAWTLVAFNNSRVRCYSSDPIPDPYVDSYMIEAEFLQVEAFSDVVWSRQKRIARNSLLRR